MQRRSFFVGHPAIDEAEDFSRLLSALPCLACLDCTPAPKLSNVYYSYTWRRNEERQQCHDLSLRVRVRMCVRSVEPSSGAAVLESSRRVPEVQTLRFP